jgi:hypothetical protein
MTIGCMAGVLLILDYTLLQLAGASPAIAFGRVAGHGAIGLINLVVNICQPFQIPRPRLKYSGCVSQSKGFLIPIIDKTRCGLAHNGIRFCVDSSRRT